jgi:outer membrane receptor protein involved in Fe transport
MGGLPSPNAYGSTTNENVFLINGVNTTSPRASSYGSLVQVNYNAVEEVRIIALGSKAEYGSFSGVAIDVLTKSGSNVLHGNTSFYSILGKSANNQPEPANLGKLGDKVDMFIQTNPHTNKPEEIQRKNIKELEGNFTLGGPIIKDKIWFYGGIDYVRSETDVPIFPVNSNWYGRFGDLKISAAPLPNHRAWIAYHYESNDSKGGTWENTWDGDMNYNMHNINNSVSAQWQWMASGKTVLTAKYLGFWADDRPSIPETHPPQSGYVNWWKWMRFGVNGHFPYVEAQKSSRQTFQADVSHYTEDFLGEHDIKLGVQYTRGRSNWLGGYFHGYANFAYPLRWTQNISYATNWYGDTGMQWYVWQFHTKPFLTVRTSDQLGLFIDDQWNPTKRLTINLGLRYDKMTAKYGTGKIYERRDSPFIGQ